MELRALRYFVTVAEELHFGRAAERLRIVQPAVSQQVARLERELGTRLFDRSPRHVRLTPAGTRVLGAAREAIAAADRVRVAAGTPAAVVRMGTAPGLTVRLERALDVLRVADPDFSVALVDLPVPARLDAVRDGHLDVALVRGLAGAPGLEVRPAWTEALHAVMSPRHPVLERGDAVVTLAAMTSHPLRHPSRDGDPPLHDAVDLAVRRTGLCPALGRPAGTVADTVVEVGSDDRTWALLPADLVAATGSTRVRSVPLDPPLHVTGAVVTRATHTEACAEALVRAFGDGT